MKKELLGLFDAYDAGEFSFAEIFLASGMTVKEFIMFMKENGIEVRMNFDFLDKGKGLNEDALERILRMNGK